VYSKTLKNDSTKKALKFLFLTCRFIQEKNPGLLPFGLSGINDKPRRCFSFSQEWRLQNSSFIRAFVASKKHLRIQEMPAEYLEIQSEITNFGKNYYEH